MYIVTENNVPTSWFFHEEYARICVTIMKTFDDHKYAYHKVDKNHPFIQEFPDGTDIDKILIDKILNDS